MRLVIDLQGAQGASRLRGIGRYSRELALAMARAPQGHEVVLALNASLPCDELVDAFSPHLPAANIRLWHGPGGTGAVIDGAHDLRRAAELLRAEFLTSLRPDLLHVSSIFEGASDNVITRWPSALERPPIVATCYDLIPLIRRTEYLDGPWKGGVVRDWYFRQLREMLLCDGLLAISESSRNEPIRHLGYDPDRVFNIRTGISPGFAPRHLDADAAAAVLARYGLPADFVLFVGAGDLRKNEAGLIRGYALLPEALRLRHPLVIVGKTDPDQLARAAAAASLPFAQLRLVDFVAEEDLTALYSLCAAFILPSLHEGFGLPAAEAMACGAPTIASDNSSLPEVLGRTDTLFRAEVPAEIASRLERVLTDAPFRAALVEHGPRQAGLFTWEESAARAWAALETIHARGGRSWPRRLRRLPRLAFVSPLPPDETGIAGYAAELALVLGQHYDITLVCERGITDAEPLASLLPVMTHEQFLSQSEPFERVLYQVGNSPFHAVQVERMLPIAPGVVTLHDSFLSGLVNWRAWTSGKPERLAADLLREHGWAALVVAAREGMDAAVGQYPCSQAVLRAALGVVQHSTHARALLTRHFGAALTERVALIPLLHQPVLLPSRADARAALGVPEDAFLVCSFGIISNSKGPGLLLSGFEAVQADIPGALLRFVGEPLQEVLALLPAHMMTGRTDLHHYQNWLAAADVAVQLRLASRGETSAAVADCLGAGLATLVNDLGAAAELPDGVAYKLPASADAPVLAAALLELARDPDRRAALGQAARSYAQEALAPVQVAAAYHAAIEAAYADGPAIQRWRLESEAGAGLSASAPKLAALASSVSRTFPSPRPQQLLLACGAVEALPAPLAALVRDCLANHPAWLRVHTVTLGEFGLVQDWAAATALLGLPMPDGEQQHAELGPGDVLLSLAPKALEPAILMAARALGVATPRLEEAGLTGAASIATLLGRYAPAYQHVTESESIIRSNGIV
ncbi:glycosyltransferase [Rhodovarius sp.]|uniref:glycosyltransferase n=1 Tax=Rhodovarius sp. TaxID=2972673 RepID=UPI0033411B82